MAKKIFRSTLIIIMLLLLSACGTLEVGVEPNLAQLEAAPAPSFEAMMLAQSGTALADNAPLLQTPTPVPSYSVFIQADAPDRCDVTVLPETAQIVNSFRVLQKVPLK